MTALLFSKKEITILRKQVETIYCGISDAISTTDSNLLYLALHKIGLHNKNKHPELLSLKWETRYWDEYDQQWSPWVSVLDDKHFSDIEEYISLEKPYQLREIFSAKPVGYLTPE